MLTSGVVNTAIHIIDRNWMGYVLQGALQAEKVALNVKKIQCFAEPPCDATFWK